MSRLIRKSKTRYSVRLAASPSEIEAAQRLRYAVFNLELNEGLDSSHQTGRDADPFDAVCDHLLVEDHLSGAIVGTYRLQTGATAAARLGYYSEQEFDFAPFERFRGQMVELGRACVEQEHRNLVVLGLLWKAIGTYALERGSRYLCGCSSLTSQMAAEGAAAFKTLSTDYLAEPEWLTVPKIECRCPMDVLASPAPKIPKLLRAYLALGARICGPPALDRQFKTIDFLTLLDLEKLSSADRLRFLL